MVTDEEHRKLLRRVEDLENKLNLLSQQYTAMLMRGDMAHKVDYAVQKKESRRKDVTKYTFEGKVLSKRELVLTCVRKYVVDNDILEGTNLLNVFPDYVQGSLGIIKRVCDAERYSDSSKRFYFEDDCILHFYDDDYVVCKDWNNQNINRFIKLAEDLGYDIYPIEKKYYI